MILWLMLAIYLIGFVVTYFVVMPGLPRGLNFDWIWMALLWPIVVLCILILMAIDVMLGRHQ